MTLGQILLISVIGGFIAGAGYSVYKLIKERKAAKNEEVTYYSDSED